MAPTYSAGRLTVIPKLATIILLVLFLTQYIEWAYGAGIIGIRPFIFFAVIMAIMAGYILADICCIERSLSRPAARNNLIAGGLLALILAWSIVNALFHNMPWENSLRNSVWLAAELLAFFLFMYLGSFVYGENVVRLGALIAFSSLAASEMVDLLFPGSLSKEVHRAAGFAENPNEAAFLIVLLMTLVITYRGKARISDMVILLTGGISVFVTLSRAGAVLYFALICLYFWPRIKKFTGRVFIHGVAYISAGVVIWFGLMSFIISESRMFETVAATNRVGMLTGNESFITSDSERIQLIHKYLQLISRQPFFGYSIGFSDSFDLGPHNMFLYNWVENGIIGLVLYITFLCYLTWIFVRRRYDRGVALCVLLWVESIFHHDLLLRPELFAVIGALVGVSSRHLHFSAKAGSPRRA